MALGISIGIPSNGRKTEVSWAMGFVSQCYPPGITIEYNVCRNADLCVARNHCVKMALKSNREYLWFVDDDIILPGSAFNRLVHALMSDPKAGAVGGIYVTKTEPAWPLVFEKLQKGPMMGWRLGEVFPVEGIGTGCMLVRTEVFSKLPEPWFEFKKEMPGPGVQWHMDQSPEATTNSFLGEDLGFCKKLNEIGYSVLAHGGVLCGHVDDNGNIYGMDVQKSIQRAKEAGVTIDHPELPEATMPLESASPA